MTTQHLRDQLLDDYIHATQGQTIDPHGHPSASSVPLAQDYIQFLIQRRLPMIVGTPKEWAGKIVGRTLANLPGTHESHGRHDAPPRREPWAVFTPSPFVNPHRRHRETVWPERGDLIVFSGDRFHPHGSLGIFIEREDLPGTLWNVYTQGLGPCDVVSIDTIHTRPLGWWRVTDNRLRLRDTGSIPAQ